MVKQFPYMTRQTIPKNTPTFEREIETFDIGGPLLTVRTDADEKLVYQVVKMVHQNLDRLASEVRYFEYAKLNPAVLTTQIGVPYHPGAVRYWKEAGLWKE